MAHLVVGKTHLRAERPKLEGGVDQRLLLGLRFSAYGLLASHGCAVRVSISLELYNIGQTLLRRRCNFYMLRTRSFSGASVAREGLAPVNLT